MIPNDPVGEFVLALLFSVVLIWVALQGLPELAQWLKHSSDDRDDIGFFPDEVRDEPGPGVSASTSRRN